MTSYVFDQFVTLKLILYNCTYNTRSNIQSSTHIYTYYRWVKEGCSTVWENLAIVLTSDFKTRLCYS